ncbi:PaaI family thioesterase [Pseudactinotalea suaedae]|uniref:PaaI family thioesterase n=1 Tax=Pseudactinotalea suaedae TaxID=1524924 RepID=UPI0012E2BEAC|nr:PaaI family thioesterase [Pseudactinotalea suaedae]
MDEKPTGPTETRTIEFTDPLATARLGMTLSGLEFLRGMADGTVPPPPIAVLMNMDIESVEEGRVSFGGTPDPSHYNPIGMVHGGFAATMLDTVCGCAVHSTLPAGKAYTSIEIKVSYLRPLQAGTRLVATGVVTKPGSRVAFAEATLAGMDGTLVATASSSLLVFDPRT